MNYFIQEALEIAEAPSKDATHFAITNGGEIRYLIDLNHKSSRRRLAKNISAYSSKLSLLLRLLIALPYRVFALLHIGKYVKVAPEQQIMEVLNELKLDCWNVIVGSYVDKQKIVLQAFCSEGNDKSVYIKVGGKSSDCEMQTETQCLQQLSDSDLYTVPHLLMAQSMKVGKRFNIQVTEEFGGERVPPVMTEDIYKIFTSIIASKPAMRDDGEIKVFSHGDFTPWNMKKEGSQYVVFDWEYAGYRFYGFDLIHFLWQVENKLNDQPEHEAFILAYQAASKLDSRVAAMSEEVLEKQYFDELTKQFGEKH